MARTKLTPRSTGPGKKSSESDPKSGPSANQVTARPSTSSKKRRQKHAPDRRQKFATRDSASTSADTNERETRSLTVKRMVAARSLKAWKPLRFSTKKYTLQLFDTAVEMLLSRTSDSVLNDLQSHMTRMRRRFAEKLEKSRGPVNNITNYNNLHKLLDSHQHEQDAEIELTLNKQLEVEERELRNLEEELDTYKLYKDGASQLHPLLREEAKS